MEAEGKEDTCCPACMLVAAQMPQQGSDSTDPSNGPINSVVPGPTHQFGLSSKLVAFKKLIQDPKRIKPDEKVQRLVPFERRKHSSRDPSLHPTLTPTPHLSSFHLTS